MSLESKRAFINDVTTKLSGTLTVSDMQALTAALADELSRYDMSGAEAGRDVEGRELLEEFLAAKSVEGKSQKTIERYRYLLTRMMDSIELPIRDIMVYTLRRYLAQEKARGLQDTTLEGIRSVITSFFGWLHREDLLPANPAANLAPIRCEKKVKKPLSSVDVARLRECCGNLRDRAIVSLLLSTGCRVSEICGLNRDSVDFGNLECTVRGKGNKQRVVYLDEVTAMQLKRYLFTRADSAPAMFVGKGSKRLTPGGVRFMLHKLAEAAGVENVHPHRFRRTLASSLADHGMPIQEVACILGHEKLETTMKYVYIDKANVKNDYRRFA